MSSLAKSTVTDGYKGTKAKMISSEIHHSVSYFGEKCP